MLTSVSCVLIGIVPSLVLILVCAAGYTFGDMLSATNSITLRQELTPITCWAASPPPSGQSQARRLPSAAALTLLAGRVGGAEAITIGGFFFVALTIFGFFTPARRRHPERDMA